MNGGYADGYGSYGVCVHQHVYRMVCLLDDSLASVLDDEDGILMDNANYLTVAFCVSLVIGLLMRMIDRIMNRVYRDRRGVIS